MRIEIVHVWKRSQRWYSVLMWIEKINYGIVQKEGGKPYGRDASEVLPEKALSLGTVCASGITFLKDLRKKDLKSFHGNISFWCDKSSATTRTEKRSLLLICILRIHIWSTSSAPNNTGVGRPIVILVSLWSISQWYRESITRYRSTFLGTTKTQRMF